MADSRSLLKTVFIALTISSFVSILWYGRSRESRDATATSMSCASDLPESPRASPRAKLFSEVSSGIKKLVFFVGYPRSGHSIVGALMDAHPHVVIPHEYFLFAQFRTLNQAPDKNWRDNLFNALYNKSK